MSVGLSVASSLRTFLMLILSHEFVLVATILVAFGALSDVVCSMTRGIGTRARGIFVLDKGVEKGKEIQKIVQG